MTNDWWRGLYRLPVAERQARVVQARGLSATDRALMQAQQSQTGAQLIENYLTDYHLPEGLLTDLVVNGRRYCLPLVTEEPSVVAAANNGAQRVAKCGGFTAPGGSRRLVGQVVLEDLADPAATMEWLTAHTAAILAVANAAHPGMARRGGGAKEIRLRLEPPFLSLDLLIDVVDAMGANSVNTMAEAVADWLHQRDYSVLVAILSNLATDSLQTVTCRLDPAVLATKEVPGDRVAERIAALSTLAQVDPSRAATHNKGIMNGIDAVLLASGNDWRAIEAGAHAYAVRAGHYRGLATWELREGQLVGKLTLPMPVGVVGGSIKLTAQSRLNYHLSGVRTAAELAQVTAAAGLAQNLAALRALATSGIQAGHMRLQYRSLAMAVGATPLETGALAARLARLPRVDQEVAASELVKMRKEHENG